MTDEELMRLALAEAEKARAEGEIPVGAVIVKDGNVLFSAHNERETHHDPTAHAEITCLRGAAAALKDWRLRDCTLYVTLEPCPMCAGAMVMSQLDRVVFGASDPLRGCCGSVYDLPGDPQLQGRTVWKAGVLQEKCQKVLEGFFEELRDQ